MYTNWIVNVPTQRPYISFVSVVRFDFESRQLCVDADSNVNFKWIFINNVYGHRECWKAHERQVSGYSCYYIYIYMTHGSSDKRRLLYHHTSWIGFVYNVQLLVFFCFSIMACYFVLVVSSHFINAKTKAKIVICLCRVECKYETWKHKNAHSVLPPTTTIAIVGLLLLHRKCTQIVYTQRSRASSTPQFQFFFALSVWPAKNFKINLVW